MSAFKCEKDTKVTKDTEGWYDCWDRDNRYDGCHDKKTKLNQYFFEGRTYEKREPPKLPKLPKVEPKDGVWKVCSVANPNRIMYRIKRQAEIYSIEKSELVYQQHWSNYTFLCCIMEAKTD